jgi:hypothetical protein
LGVSSLTGFLCPLGLQGLLLAILLLPAALLCLLATLLFSLLTATLLILLARLAASLFGLAAGFLGGLLSLPAGFLSLKPLLANGFLLLGGLSELHRRISLACVSFGLLCSTQMEGRHHPVALNHPLSVGQLSAAATH